MNLKRTLSRDFETAKMRLSSLVRHPNLFLTIELVAAAVTLLWGMAVLRPGADAMSLPVYAEFSYDDTFWGWTFVLLAVVSCYNTLTSGRSARFVSMGLTVFCFAQIVWRIYIGPYPAHPDVVVYAFIGVVLPMVAAFWQLLQLVLDQVREADPEMWAHWLGEHPM